MAGYKVIYADPPWSYRNKRTGGSMLSGAASKYPVMDIEDIKNLSVSSISDNDCALFLWATTPLLPEAFDVLSAWGFKYKTAIYWRKIMSLGMGYWFRGQVEVCLLGIRGDIKAFRIQKPNFIQSKALQHSEKPVELRQLIEATGLSPRLELFATRKADGWDGLGNVINGEDIRISLARIGAESHD
jgi:N6-adenosine-specific RNA methylase IME4